MRLPSIDTMPEPLCCGDALIAVGIGLPFISDVSLVVFKEKEFTGTR